LRLSLLLLPGMLSDADYYAAQLEGLRDLAEISIPAYPRVATIGAMARQVLGAAPACFAVCGHSMGGRVAQEIIAQAPARVLALALCATDFRAPHDAAERAREQAQRRAWLARVDQDGFDAFAHAWAESVIAPAHRADQALIARIVAMAARHGRDGLAAHTSAGLSRPDYAHLLPQIRVPTLLLAGREDRLRPPETLQRMAQQIPGARLRILEDCGHMLSMEAPAAVNQSLRAWLADLRT